MRKTITAAALLLATAGGIAAGAGAASAESAVDTGRVESTAPVAHDGLAGGDEEEGFPNGFLDGLLDEFFDRFDAEDLIGG